MVHPVIDFMLTTNNPNDWKKCWDQLVEMPAQELTPPASPVLGATSVPVFDFSNLTIPCSPRFEPLEPTFDDFVLDNMSLNSPFYPLEPQYDPCFIPASQFTPIAPAEPEVEKAAPKKSSDNHVVPPMPKDAFRAIRDPVKGQLFECTVHGCGKIFTRKAENAKAHWLLHQNLIPYNCGTCGAGFRRKHDLKRHTKSVHQ